MAQERSLSQYARNAIRLRTLVGVMNAEKRRSYRMLARVKFRETMLQRAPGGSAAASDMFIEPLTSLIDRRVPTLLLFGEEDDAYGDLQRARAGRLGDVLQRGQHVVALEVAAGKLHGLRTVAAQEDLIQRTLDWTTRLVHSSTDHESTG